MAPNTRSSLAFSRSKGASSVAFAVSSIKALSVSKLSPVRKRGQVAPYLLNAVGIDFCKYHALAFRALPQDLAPGIDDHRMAVGSPAGGVGTTLRRRDHVGQVLDRARAQE